MIAKPMFNYLFVTVNEDEFTESGITKTAGNVIKNVQQVLVKGPNVDKSINVGDMIGIKWTSYEVRGWTDAKSEISKDIEKKGSMHVEPPIIEILDPTIPGGSTVVMRISDRDIDYVLPQEEIATFNKRSNITLEKVGILKPN